MEKGIACANRYDLKLYAGFMASVMASMDLYAIGASAPLSYSILMLSFRYYILDKL